MASLLRYSAISALVSSVAGFAVGAIPSQTIGGGFGQPFFDIQPTTAPSVELVKKQLAKKALTNVCTEWTIPGGYGQPQCFDSQTCLFQTINGRFYEGCGQTSIAYDWITQCWNYPQSGVAQKSEIFCPASAPYCGYFGFDFGQGYTFYNFGCSTSSYGLLVTRIASATNSRSTSIPTDTATTDIFADPTESSTDTATTDIFVDPTESSTNTPTRTSIFNTPNSATGTFSSASSRPTVSSTKRSKTPIGAIVGGVVGGVVALALAAFLLWFCLRKRKQKRAASAAAQSQIQNDQAAALTAYNMNAQNQNQIPEIGGTMKPAAAYVPPAQHEYPEKQAAGVGAQEVYQPALGVQQQHSSTYSQGEGNAYQISQSPPPVYTNPSSTLVPSPPNRYSELEQGEVRRTSTQGPVSPLGSLSPGQTPQRVQSPPVQGYGQVNELGGENRVNELGGETRESWNTPQRVQSPPVQVYGQVNELGGENRVNELGGENRGSWNTPPGVQELGAGGNASGGIARRPVNTRGNFDLSGAPMSEEYRHELQ